VDLRDLTLKKNTNLAAASELPCRKAAGKDLENRNHDDRFKRTFSKNKGDQRSKIPSDIAKTRTTQVDGFFRCLEFLLRKWRIKVDKINYLNHLRFSFSTVLEKDQPKLFKLSLATFFSQTMKQELPEGSDSAIILFPKTVKRFVYRILAKSNVRKLKFCFDVLQCKSLSAEVPRSMIVEAYQKHAKQLSAPCPSLTRKICDSFDKFITPYIDALPTVLPCTKLAKRKAYLGFSRKRGGLHEALRSQTNLFDYKSLRPRLEPTVLHLEGKPGIAKSLISAHMGKMLDRYFGMENSIHWKSSTSQHFDGYDQQPVMGIDDMFYQMMNSSADNTKTEELLQLVSTVDYQPPMADLQHKGIRFVSPILLLSSNKGNTYLRMLSTVNNPEAIMRRIDLNYYLEKDGDRFLLTQHTLKSNDDKSRCPSNQEKSYSQNPYFYPGIVRAFDTILEVSEFLFNLVIKKYEAKRDFYLDQFSPYDPVIRQRIEGTNRFYEFPKNPGKEISIVEAYAIPEPLKVRMITKGHPNTWCLKPVQRAMESTLRKFQIFEPCSNPEFQKTYSPISGKILVSGDYSSATDGINQFLTRIVGTRIAGKYPELAAYILAGTSEHIVQYPKGAQQYDICQTSGQLMGSLLSFPILCLVNAFTLGYVRGQALEELDCLIHGDDLSFCGSPSEVREWKAVASSVGLEPSIGKNYLSENWYTIDSKLFLDGRHVPNLKWKQLADPGPNEVSQILTVLNIPQTIHFCKKILDKTYRSLEVDITFGGLNPKGRIPSSSLEKAIYVGASLNRLPRLTKNELTLFENDLDGETDTIEREIDIFADVKETSSYQWYQEKSWLKYFNHYTDIIPEGWEQRLNFKPITTGPRVRVKFCPFLEHSVTAQIFNDTFNSNIDIFTDNGFCFNRRHK